MSWRTAHLKECARVVGGATPKSGKAEYWGGSIAWVTPKDVADLGRKHISETPRTITDLGLRKCSAELLPANSVLLSSRAPIGHVAVNTVPMATNQGFKSMIPGPDLDADFLYWWLVTHRRQIESMGNGATFKEVSKSTVENIEISLPPLSEQKRIAAILDQADELRRLRQRAITKLNGLSQSVFHDMLGYFDSASGKIDRRESALNQSNLNKSSSAQSARCALIKISKLAAVTSGNGAPQDPSAYSENGHPFVRAGSLPFLASGGTEGELKKIEPATAEDYGLKLFPKGTVLFAKSGMSATKGIIHRLEGAAYVVNHLATLLPYDERDSRFLVEALKKFSPTQLILDLGYPSIRLSDIKNFEIEAPHNIKERAKITDALQEIDELQQLYAKLDKKIKQLLFALQQRAFRGGL